MNPTKATANDADVIALSKALIQHESGGNPTIRGASKEYGLAQWVEPTWNAEAKKYLGYVPKWGTEEMTPEIQKAVVASKVADRKNLGYNPAQIAAEHNSGSKDGWENKVGVNKYGVKYDVPAYVKSVTDLYHQMKQETSAPAVQQAAPTDQYSGFLGTNPSDSLYGKVLDNSITRGIQNIFPGQKVGQAIGTAAGYIASPNKDQYDISAPTPLQVLGDVAQGALSVATPGAGEGAGFISRIGSQAALGGAFGLTGGLAQGETGIPDLLSSTASGAALGGALGLGGELLGAGISKLAKPFAGQVDGEVLGTASRVGIGESQLPTSAISNSKTVRYVESLYGGDRLASQVDGIQTKLRSLADETVAATGVSDDIVSAGKKIGDGFKRFEDFYQKTVSKLYDDFAETGGMKLPAKPNRSVDLIHNVMDQKAAVNELKDAQYFKDKLAVLTGGETKRNTFELPTFDTLKKVRTAVGEKIKSGFADPFVAQNKAQLKALYGALSQDMDDVLLATGNPKIISAMNKAQETYKVGRELFNTEYAKSIRRLTDSGQFDKIIPAITAPGKSVANIPAMLQVIGPENIPRLQSAILDDIFTKALGTGEAFTEKGITKGLNRYGEDRLSLILTPEQLGVVRDIDKITQAISQAEKVSKGSQTAFLAKNFAKLSLGTTGIVQMLSGNIAGGVMALAPILGESLIQKFLASGIGRRILTEGIDVSKIEGAIRQTTKAANMQVNK